MSLALGWDDVKQRVHVEGRIPAKGWYDHHVKEDVNFLNKRIAASTEFEFFVNPDELKTAISQIDNLLSAVK